jgi:hypothetical protein
MIWRAYQSEYKNHLRMLREGIEYKGKENIKKQTLIIQGNKIVGSRRNAKWNIQLDSIKPKPFKSERGVKARKSK